MKNWTLSSVLLVVPVLLMGYMVYIVGFWGLPLPIQIHLIEKADTNQDGHLDTWRFDSNGDGQVDLVEQDSNHDGRVDQIQRSTPKAYVIRLKNDPREFSDLPKLAVCLDGVPYSTMAKLWDQGYFREFSRPIKVISAFPSVSDVALTEVLHTGELPGYENLYYDRKTNKIGGGVISTVSKVGIPYLEAFDYDEPGIFKGLAYFIPIKTFRADLGRFLKHYGESNATSYKAHICSTDSICHLLAPLEFEKYLLEVDTLLRKIYLQHNGKLNFIVFSDHGNAQVPHHRVDIDRFLEEYNFKVESSLRNSSSVVIPAFGLLGAMPVYSQPENTVQLAEVFSHCEGVDFSAYLDGEDVYITSSQGSACILTNETGLLKYQPQSGDPLNLNEIQRQLVLEGQVDVQGFATQTTWFQATAEHEYPDAVNALVTALKNHVTNRADLLVSFKDGYYYGSQLFEWLVTMKATHGNLRQASMTGFAMWNGPLPSTPMAARNLLKTFDHLVD